MRRLFDRIRLVSQHHHAVLIVGESGAGKEEVARAIHAHGPLARRPFLLLDCGSLAPLLLESELFGYVRGAFPGAAAGNAGLLETARGGTVLLDEIAEMPLELQFKLLRALQEHEVQPMGSHRRVRVATRILAASSRNMEVAVRDGAFRQDLYFRLNVVILRVPPLRERKSDIPLLVNWFLKKHQVAGQPRVTVSNEAVRLLQAHDWPGNVRELENCMERALALGGRPVLRCADLAVVLQQRASHRPRPASTATTPTESALNSPAQPPPQESRNPPSNVAMSQMNEVGTGDPALCPPAIGIGSTVPLAEIEKQAILHAVIASRGDRILAARRLGIGKTTVYRKLKEYGVEI